MEEELVLSDQASDAESEEVLTPSELINKLEEAWLNEKFAPELLESKSEIVECVIEQLNHMEQNLQRARQGDLKVSFHHMEIERIRFMLSSYLRSRLLKIEKFFPHVLEMEKARGDGEPPHLSPEEFAFAKEYMTSTEALLKNVALRHMPPNLQTVDLLKCVPKPNLDSFVFLRVKEAQQSILVEPETDEQSTVPDRHEWTLVADTMRCCSDDKSIQVFSSLLQHPAANPYGTARCATHTTYKQSLVQLCDSSVFLQGIQGRPMMLIYCGAPAYFVSLSQENYLVDGSWIYLSYFPQDKVIMSVPISLCGKGHNPFAMRKVDRDSPTICHGSTIRNQIASRNHGLHDQCGQITINVTGDVFSFCRKL